MLHIDRIHLQAVLRQHNLVQPTNTSNLYYSSQMAPIEDKGEAFYKVRVPSSYSNSCQVPHVNSVKCWKSFITCLLLLDCSSLEAPCSVLWMSRVTIALLVAVKSSCSSTSSSWCIVCPCSRIYSRLSLSEQSNYYGVLVRIKRSVWLAVRTSYYSE